MARSTITGQNVDSLITLTHSVAQALAAALGDGWTYSARLNGDGERGQFASVDRGDQCIGVYGSSYEGKINIDGRWDAKDALGRRIEPSYNMPKVRVSMSATRAAESIVKDAIRRFMPGYLAAHAKYAERIESERAYLASTTGAAQQLAASGAFYLEEQRVRSWGQRESAPDGERVRAWCERISNVKVYRDSVSMDLRDLTPAQAIAIAKLLG